MPPPNFKKEAMNEDNKTIAASICREHAKNYGGPSTPANTVSAIVSELDKRDSELVALKSKLAAIEKHNAYLGEVLWRYFRSEELLGRVIDERLLNELGCVAADLKYGPYHLITPSPAVQNETEALKCEAAALREQLGEAEKVLRRGYWLMRDINGSRARCIVPLKAPCKNHDWLDEADALLSSPRSATKGNLSTDSDGEGK